LPIQTPVYFHSGMKEARRVPDAELDVLACLERARRATAADLVAMLHTVRPMQHGSVLTLLARLEAKGLVERRKGDRGKAYVYSTTARSRRAVRQVIDRLMERVFGGDRLEFVASLLDGPAPTPAEIARLERLIDELRGRRPPRSGRART
jgi:predicted transcriptional regulator